MRRILLGLEIVFLMSLAWIFPIKEEVFASSSDRMIVNLIDADGNETTESILIEEIQKFQQGEPLNAVSLLHNIQKLETLQPDFIRQVALQADDDEATSWGHDRVGVKNLKSKVANIEGTAVVAVIDTGIDDTHPFLGNRIVNGHDFIENDAKPMDVHFHGTHVAGIIADITPDNVKIMPIRVLDKNGQGYDSDVAKGIRYAVDNDADIINLSFVGDEFSQYLSDAIEYAHSKNVLVVVASGNEGGDTANYYPASDANVLVVSAVDQNDTIASFSNTGSSIDISAPGVGIISSVPGNRFESHSGTSMAVPFVSGIAAMLKLENPNRSAQEMERLIKMHVDDRGANGWDPLYGEGIVNILAYDVNPIETPVLSKEFVTLAFQENVPLNKTWTINFNRRLTDRDTMTIKIFNDDKEIPIIISPNYQEKQIRIAPANSYSPQSTYRMIVDVENGESYQMEFVTGA